MTRTHLIVAAATLLAGCMGQPTESSTPPPATATTGAAAVAPGSQESQESAEPLGPNLEINELQSNVEQAGAELATTLSADAIDCDEAGRLRDQICDLSSRICAIADRHPQDVSVHAHCDNGNERCERARQDVDDAC